VAPRWLGPALWAYVVVTLGAIAWLVVRWQGRFPAASLPHGAFRRGLVLRAELEATPCDALEGLH